MKIIYLLLFFCLTINADVLQKKMWKCIYFKAPDINEVDEFNDFIEKVIAPAGFNVVILEITFNYEFDKRLNKNGYLDKKAARSISKTCEKNGIELIPLLQCMGHQSWGKTVSQLLKVYPEFDETPGKYPDNKGIYSRSWCPLHPKINKVVFKMMDEIIDAFNAKILHVGMDEILIIADKDCPRCSGKDPAKILAKAINDYHSHIVDKRGIQMMMWGDRLNDPNIADYGITRSSHNGTAPAIDMIPKDIIICDWYYGVRKNYKSLNVFQEKGFRVIPTGFYQPDGNRAFLDYARVDMTPRMLGFMFTTWGVNFRDLEKALLMQCESNNLSDVVVKLASSIKECLPLIKPAPRISIEVPDETNERFPFRTLFYGKRYPLKVSVFPENNYGKPQSSVEGVIAIKSLKNQKEKIIGKLPSMTDFKTNYFFKLAKGNFQIIIFGKVNFFDGTSQEFKLLGPEFYVIEKSELENPVRRRILKSEINYEDMISWLNIFPKGGKKLTDVSVKSLCESKISKRGDYLSKLVLKLLHVTL